MDVNCGCPISGIRILGFLGSTAVKVLRNATIKNGRKEMKRYYCSKIMIYVELNIKNAWRVAPLDS